MIASLYKRFRYLLHHTKRQLLYGNVLRQAKHRSFDFVEQHNLKHVLVLCYGNIYRSPFVDQLLQKYTAQNDDAVKSAGFYYKSGRPSPDSHIVMSRQFDIDLSQHKSTVISDALIDWADVIVIMDLPNWIKLKSLAPNALSKTIWLGAFCEDDNIEIPDPYGKDPDTIHQILTRLNNGATKLANKLFNV